MKRKIKGGLAPFPRMRFRSGAIADVWHELLRGGIMKRGNLSFLVLGLVVSGQVSIHAAEDNDENDRKAVELDVAVDCRTYKYNRGIPGDQALQGDSYLVKGRIFPAGTLRPGS